MLVLLAAQMGISKPATYPSLHMTRQKPVGTSGFQDLSAVLSFFS